MVKKLLIVFLIALVLLNYVSAINLVVENQNEIGTYISGLNKPVSFYLNITNRGAEDNIEFYNLQGFRITPVGTVHIGEGEIKEIQLLIYLGEKFSLA